MNANAYLFNPVITPGFYYVKCLEVETFNGTVIVKLKVVPSVPYGEARNAVLHATLRGSLAAQPMHQMFRHTFRVQGDSAEAIGRFGSVLVDTAEFQGNGYSGVHFIRQSGIARQQATALEQSEEEGEIPWTADDDDGVVVC